MKFQIGSMSAGDILDRGLKLLLARLPALYLINLIVLSPLIAYQVAMPYLITLDPSDPFAALLPMLLGTFAVIILTLILQPIGTAAILRIVSQEFIDRHVGVGDAFSFALSRFGSLLGASILAGLIIALGMLCCLVPGLIFLTWYAFVAQVVVVEGQGPLAALERSRRLGEGYYGRTFGILFLMGLLSVAVSYVISFGLGQVLPAAEIVPVAGGVRIVTHPSNQAIHQLVSQLVAILVGAFQAVCTTLLYFDLRIRKEGYDLEVAAGSQTAASPDFPEPRLDVP